MKETDQRLHELFQQPAALPDYVDNCVLESYRALVEKRKAKQLTRRPMRKLSAAALAAVISVLLLGSALAVGIARLEMTVEENGQIDFVYSEDGRPSFAGAWEISEPPKGFQQTCGVITGFVPGAYEFSAEYAMEGDANERLYLFVNTLDGTQMGRQFQPVLVNGTEGILYYSELFDGVEDSLVWSDPQQGLVFTLEYFGQQKLDLVSIGESVTACAYVPSGEETEALLTAIDSLGDYTLSPPAGYEYLLERSSGNGDTAAIQKIWGNSLYDVMTLEYTALDDPTVAIRDYVVNMKNYLTMDGREFVTVSGMDGCFKTVTDSIYGDTVMLVWLDRENALAFTLYGEVFSKEDLLALAESVTNVN